MNTIQRCPLRLRFDDQIGRLQRRGGISRYFDELRASLVIRADVNVVRSRHQSVDLVHATFYRGRPYRFHGRQSLVSSLFDMIPERHPEHFFLPALRSPHANKAAWLAASDLILSISAASADDLSFFQPSLSTPVQVIHLATAIDSLPPLAVSTLVGRRFWLMVGKRHAYKNGSTLLRALARLHKGMAPRDMPLLVFAGGAPLGQQERLWIERNGLSEHVHQLMASDLQLAWLYQKAEAVLVPSMAEGFSLPLIEAFACNTPVIASDNEVHREVGGQFATFVPALNAQLWADLLSAAGKNPLTRPQNQLGACAYMKLRRYYDLPRMIEQHLHAYRRLSSHP